MDQSPAQHAFNPIVAHARRVAEGFVAVPAQVTRQPRSAAPCFVGNHATAGVTERRGRNTRQHRNVGDPVWRESHPGPTQCLKTQRRAIDVDVAAAGRATADEQRRLRRDADVRTRQPHARNQGERVAWVVDRKAAQPVAGQPKTGTERVGKGVARRDCVLGGSSTRQVGIQRDDEQRDPKRSH